MANKKISQLTAAAALTGTEILPIVQGGVTVQTTAQDIADLGGGDLQQVTDVGNTTTNNINLDNSAIVLDNGSLLQKGFIDNGADGGIARICSIGYQDEWENGVQYFVSQNSNQIVWANSINNTVPDVNFDVTMGYVPGSIFHDMNNHNKYICTDNTNGAAVWNLYYDSKPYKVYTALLTQTDTDAPVATVLENTLGFLPNWQYVDIGTYSINNVLFTNDKTTVNVFLNVNGNSYSFPSTVVSPNVTIHSVFLYDFTYMNSLLNNTAIEIRVYN